jgi:phage-related protein
MRCIWRRSAKSYFRAKPLKGLGPGVLEIVSDYRGDTYRGMYTVRFAAAELNEQGEK